MSEHIEHSPKVRPPREQEVLANYLLKGMGLTKSLVAKLFRKRLVRVNGKRAKADFILKAEDQVIIPQSLDISSQKLLAENNAQANQDQNPKTLKQLQNAILYEGENELILNKPPGLAVQGGTKLKDALSWYLKGALIPGQELFIVHRLDQETQGVLLLAKNLEAARYYGVQFQSKAIEKTYHAVVIGRPENDSGIIDMPIAKGIGEQGRELMFTANREPREENSHDPSRINQEAKEAITHYQVLKHDSKRNVSLVALKIETGRKHQIRVHLSQVLKTPILGDRKYGAKQPAKTGKETNRVKYLRLCATKLTFFDVKGIKRNLEIPLPTDFFHVDSSNA